MASWLFRSRVASGAANEGKACSKLGLHYVRDLPLNLTFLTTTISISRVGEVVTDPLPLIMWSRQ